MPKNTIYTLDVPEKGDQISILAKNAQIIEPSGKIVSVHGPHIKNNLDSYQVRTGHGDWFEVVHLVHDSAMDEKAHRCYRILAHGKLTDPEYCTCSHCKKNTPFIIKLLSGVLDWAKKNPKNSLKLLFFLGAIAAYILGHSELGDKLKELGSEIVEILQEFTGQRIAPKPIFGEVLISMVFGFGSL